MYETINSNKKELEKHNHSKYYATKVSEFKYEPKRGAFDSYINELIEKINKKKDLPLNDRDNIFIMFLFDIVHPARIGEFLELFYRV